MRVSLPIMMLRVRFPIPPNFWISVPLKVQKEQSVWNIQRPSIVNFYIIMQNYPSAGIQFKKPRKFRKHIHVVLLPTDVWQHRESAFRDGQQRGKRGWGDGECGEGGDGVPLSHPHRGQGGGVDDVSAGRDAKSQPPNHQRGRLPLLRGQVQVGVCVWGGGGCTQGCNDIFEYSSEEKYFYEWVNELKYEWVP